MSFTSLYPHAAMPTHGIFVENRLRQLLSGGEVELAVVAPVPTNPFSWAFIRNPAFTVRENRHGIEVWRPTAAIPPAGGMYLAPTALACAGRRAIDDVVKSGFEFDLIDAHYVYPDGAAAAALARHFDKPFVVTARGTDVSVMPDYRLPRRRIMETLEAAAHIIAVSDTIKKRILALGLAEAKVTVLRNGVDLDTFRPQSRDKARRNWGVSGFVVLSVGHLIPRKGHDLVIRAVSQVPGATLLIAGDGKSRKNLTALADSLGVAHRVRFLGRLSQAELPGLYSAADVMVLASEREGWANVILESLACGTPVIASDIDENRDVLAGSDAGQLVPRTVDGMRQGLDDFRASPIDRSTARAFAEAHGWDPTSAGQVKIFRRIMEGGATS